jgi:integrase
MRRLNGSGSQNRPKRFPYRFEKNGRVGKIYRLGNGTFKTYFRFAGKAFQNTFQTCEAAFLYLENEFLKLDSDTANSLSQNPLNSSVKEYAEFEQWLKRAAPDATLREMGTFYIAHHGKRFEPRSVAECAEIYVKHQRANNISPQQIEALEKHFRRFGKDFGNRKIHEISMLDISNWLATQTDERNGRLWSSKTRINNLGSLVSLSLFARDALNAIPDVGKTEFQKVRRPKPDLRPEVEIHAPEEMKTLLAGALETDIDLIPVLALGGFQGLRPAEIHAEGAKRPPLGWDALIWDDGILYVTGQKIRSKPNRSVPLHPVTEAWLRPFANCRGEIWRFKEAYIKKMLRLANKTGVRRIHDGLRHSYASYRIRQLKGNLDQLAEEMGNSPREIIRSYKRNVTDAEANAWFDLMPPPDYWERIYNHIQKRMGHLAVGLKNGQIPMAEVNALSRGNNAVLGRI